MRKKYQVRRRSIKYGEDVSSKEKKYQGKDGRGRKNKLRNEKRKKISVEASGFELAN